MLGLVNYLKGLCQISLRLHGSLEALQGMVQSGGGSQGLTRSGSAWCSSSPWNSLVQSVIQVGRLSKSRHKEKIVGNGYDAVVLQEYSTYFILFTVTYASKAMTST